MGKYTMTIGDPCPKCGTTTKVNYDNEEPVCVFCRDKGMLREEVHYSMDDELLEGNGDGR